MKFSTENKTIVTIFFVTGLLILLLTIFFLNSENAKSTGDWIQHTEEVLNKSDNALIDIVNIESDSKGYLLTGKNYFLTSFLNDSLGMRDNLKALKILTRDNPRQQIRIESLNGLLLKRIALIKTLIERKKLNSTEINSKIEEIEKGKFIGNIIRNKFSEINEEEFILLKQRKNEIEKTSIFSRGIFIVFLLLVFTVFGLVYTLIRNHKKRNIELAEEITMQKGYEIELTNSKIKAEKATQKAEEATIKAEESNRLKESFLANMSHEIRTPMNAIMGFSDILYKLNLGIKEKEYVKIIKSEGESLLAIINDILDISKIEAGMMTLEEQNFSIREMFKSLQILLTGKIKEKKIELVFDCDAIIPDHLLGDNKKLTQIIINLVGNAIKFTAKGQIKVYAKVLDNSGPTTLVEFSVRDTGIGIAKDKLEMVFERFRQADSATSRKYGGTGLGLSISRQLVELQKGALTVKSELGKGSEFSFSIRYKKSTTVTETPSKTNREFDLEFLEKIDVLLVEDNLINIKLVSSLFTEKKIKLQVAQNGLIALEMLGKNNYDVILMDMEMPVMNGYETTEAIRKKLQNTIPIIAMTAHAMSGEKEKCLSLGMDDYISKPINANRLFEKIYALTFKKITV